MDINNIPGKLKQFGLLEASDINLLQDLVVISKRVNNLRNGSEFIDLPMTVAEFLTMTGGGGSQTLAQTLAFGNSTGDQAITSPNGLSQLFVFDSITALYSNVGSLAAPKLILDAFGYVPYAQLSQFNNIVKINATELLIKHSGDIKSIVSNGAAESKTLQTLTEWTALYHDGIGFIYPSSFITLNAAETKINHVTQLILDSPKIKVADSSKILSLDEASYLDLGSGGSLTAYNGGSFLYLTSLEAQLIIPSGGFGTDMGMGVSDTLAYPRQIVVTTAKNHLKHDTLTDIESPIFQFSADPGFGQGYILGDTTQARIGFNPIAGTSMANFSATYAELIFDDGAGGSGTVSLIPAQLNLSHSLKIVLDCANISMVNVPVGIGSVAVGELYVDTEANITASGADAMFVARRIF